MLCYCRSGCTVSFPCHMTRTSTRFTPCTLTLSVNQKDLNHPAWPAVAARRPSKEALASTNLLGVPVAVRHLLRTQSDQWPVPAHTTHSDAIANVCMSSSHNSPQYGIHGQEGAMRSNHPECKTQAISQYRTHR